MWIDTHCHTRHSHDNWLEPLDLVRRAKQLGLDGVCITEHHSYEASAPVEAVARGEGFLLLRGVEISTDRGHLLAGRAAEYRRLPTRGGSDCHKTSAAGRCATEFLQPVAGMAGFIAAVRAGACRGAYYPPFHADPGRDGTTGR